MKLAAFVVSTLVLALGVGEGHQVAAANLPLNTPDAVSEPDTSPPSSAPVGTARSGTDDVEIPSGPACTTIYEGQVRHRICFRLTRGARNGSSRFCDQVLGSLDRRFNGCGTGVLTGVDRTNRGVVVGTASVSIGYRTRLWAKSTAVDYAAQFALASATGTMAKGLYIEPVFYCTVASDCDATGAPDVKLLPGSRNSSQTVRGSVAMKININESKSITPIIGAFVNKVPARGRVGLPATRCDGLRYLGGKGCVYIRKTPTWTLSQSRYPGVSSTVRLGQRSTKFGPGVALTRHPGRNNKSARIARSICNKTKKPATGLTYQCDEYPMASTYQGCALSVPPDCVARWVEKGDNEGAGTSLGIFYAANRVQFRDDFLVRLGP